MIIREAYETDKAEIIALYQNSQNVTGLPSPMLIPPSELGDRLYQRNAIKRYVSIEHEKIIGHGMIETPNPEHLEDWQDAINDDNVEFIELGAAFVDPSKFGRGIWSALLTHRLRVVRSMGAIPVSVTWTSNLHVQNTLKNMAEQRLLKKKQAQEASAFISFSELAQF